MRPPRRPWWTRAWTRRCCERSGPWPTWTATVRGLHLCVCVCVCGMDRDGALMLWLSTLEMERERETYTGIHIHTRTYTPEKQTPNHTKKQRNLPPKQGCWTWRSSRWPCSSSRTSRPAVCTVFVCDATVPVHARVFGFGRCRVCLCVRVWISG